MVMVDNIYGTDGNDEIIGIEQDAGRIRRDGRVSRGKPGFATIQPISPVALECRVSRHQHRP